MVEEDRGEERRISKWVKELVVEVNKGKVTKSLYANLRSRDIIIETWRNHKSFKLRA